MTILNAKFQKPTGPGENWVKFDWLKIKRQFPLNNAQLKLQLEIYSVGRGFSAYKIKRFTLKKKNLDRAHTLEPINCGFRYLSQFISHKYYSS